MRSRFYFYRDWIEIINDSDTGISDSEKLELFQAIVRYGCYKDLGDVSLSPVAKALFAGLKKRLTDGWEAYEKQCERNKANSQKGAGAPKGNKNALKDREQQAKEKQSTGLFSIVSSDSELDSDIDNFPMGNDKDSEINKTYTHKGETIDFNNLIQDFNLHIRANNSPVREIKAITAKRKKALNSLLGKFTKADIESVFEMVSKSDFTAKLGKVPDFDWILKEDNFVQILEGNFLPSAEAGSGRNTARGKGRRDEDKHINDFWK